VQQLLTEVTQHSIDLAANAPSREQREMFSAIHRGYG